MFTYVPDISAGRRRVDRGCLRDVDPAIAFSPKMAQTDSGGKTGR